MTHDILTVAVISVTTILTRALPFMLFPEGRKIPKVILLLSKYLPCAVMGMLIVYCLKSVSFISSPFGIPEFLAITLVAITYIWKKNTLLSIISGTACYMLLIQLVFN